MKNTIPTIFFLVFVSIFLNSCAPSACECANILSDRTAEGDVLMKKALEGNGTFEPRNEYWASKARKCMQAFTDMKDWEIQSYQSMGNMISSDAIANAEKECEPNTNYNDEQINLACDCWKQSYSKSGLEFDKMTMEQQKIRKKCVELFSNEKSMESACNSNSENSSNQSHSDEDTGITIVKLPPSKKDNNKEYEASVNKTLKIGDKAFGGVIIEIDNYGKHGLVMSLKDQDNFLIKQEDDLPNKDYKRAFKVCNDLNLDGFNDWRLPEQNELTLIYTNGKKYLSDKPGMYLDKFSTSFFMNESGSVCYNRIDNETVNYYRGNDYKIRAVRKF
jgi:hypothetical protein